MLGIILRFVIFIWTLSILCHNWKNSGATNPEYVVTADDVDKRIAVECIPMDNHGQQVFCKLYAGLTRGVETV